MCLNAREKTDEGFLKPINQSITPVRTDYGLALIRYEQVHHCTRRQNSGVKVIKVYSLFPFYMIKNKQRHF